MDTQHDTEKDLLAAQYGESVEREREAWHALQAHAPGSPERAQAWQAWSQAIVKTNDAWRRLSARRFADPSRRAAVATQVSRHARA